jgi:Ca-activated chloride channel family protein
MTFASPIFLLLLPLLLIILLIHLFRQRSTILEVSSLFFWNRVMGPRKRIILQIIRNLILLLQLLAALFLIFSLARPLVENTSTGLQGRQVMIIDGSASMLATSGSESRFRNALELARAEIRKLSGSLSIILAGAEPQPLIAYTESKGDLRDALQNLDATQGPADMDAALKMARELGAEGITIISDGAFSATLPENARVLFVEGQSENVGITGFSVREGDNGLWQIYCEISNFSSITQIGTLTITLEGKPFRSFEYSLPSGARDSFSSYYEGLEGGRLVAEISSEDDFFIDNRAYELLQAGPSISILLVSPGNFFLESLLRVDSDVQLTWAEEYREGNWDMVILDRSRANTGSLPSLNIASPPEGFGILGQGAPGSIVSWDRNHPILDGTSLADLVTSQSYPIENADGIRHLISGTNGNLLSIYETPGKKFAYLAFPLESSSLVLDTNFPILMKNILTWLVPEAGRSSAYKAGERLPTEQGTLISPIGDQAWRNEPVYAEFTGFYRFLSKTGKRSFFPVSLNSRSESNLNFSIPAVEAEVAVTNAEQTRSPVWSWFLSAVILLLLAEWWLWGKE